MFINHLASFEDRIQALIEGGLARLLAGRLHPREVAVSLVRAVEDYVHSDSGDRRYAPNIYSIRINPVDHDGLLQSAPDLIQTLAAEVVEIARSDGFILRSSPHIQLIADPSVDAHHVQITASHFDEFDESTATLQAENAVWGIKENEPAAALLRNGDHRIPFSGPLLNLGRQRDNQIIVDDPSVSRHHAQIRLRFGRHTLFDLGSSVGTLVNGQRVQEATLNAGDVITLGNSSFIYVEIEPPAGQDGGEEESATRPMGPG